MNVHETSVSAPWTFYRPWAIEPQLAQHAWPAFAVTAADPHQWPPKNLLWLQPAVVNKVVHSTSIFWNPSLILYGIKGFRCKDRVRKVYVWLRQRVLQFGSHGIWRKPWRLVSNVDSTWFKEQLWGCSFPLHVWLLSTLLLPEVEGPLSFSVFSQK